MAWYDGVEGPALDIARCNERLLRVVAGPGTGKTYAMQRRVARLLEEGTNPQRILVVTFTRNAAKNLKDDLREIGVPGVTEIWAGTLHSYCFRLLGQERAFHYLERKPRPIITFQDHGVLKFEAAPMLADLFRRHEFGNNQEMTRRIRAFEAAWARLQNQQPGWPLDPEDARFQDALVGWLKSHGAILIGELVPLALRFIQNNLDVIEQRAIQHIIVDEYQDLNKAEQVILDLLASTGNLAIVGDVDQSIYSFRHANPEGIDEFPTSHPGTHDEPLVECRRCPKRVVAIANNLIENNEPPGGEGQLVAREGNPVGEVYFLTWETLEDEANGLAQYVDHLLQDMGYEPKDIVIMCPRRQLGYLIRDTLRAEAIPVHSYYYEESVKDPEAQRSFTLMNLFANRNDAVSLRFWLGIGSPTFNSGEYERLGEYCRDNGLGIITVLEQMLGGIVRIPRTNSILERYRLLKEQFEILDSITLEELVDNLLPETEEWSRAMRDMATNALEEIETPRQLVETIKNQITQPEMPIEGDFIRVMSLHKAKGLTSKIAIITGVVQGLIPTTDSRHTEEEAELNIYEQRRLFYMAITRCREILVLSAVEHVPADYRHSLGVEGCTRWPDLYARPGEFLQELELQENEMRSGPAWLSDGFV